MTIAELRSSGLLTAVVRDQSGDPIAGRTVVWSTSDERVAGVEGSVEDRNIGVVYGLGLGTATIIDSATARADEFVSAIARAR